MGLEGRRVLVTGASSGIGAATARAVVAAGGRVALLARRADVLEELAVELGGVPVPADVTDAAAAGAAVAAAADELGGLDALVNGAGLARPGSIGDGDVDGWRTMFEVNVLGLLHVTHAAIPALTAAGRADLVNLSSLSGRRISSVEMSVYAASKHAVHALGEGLRRELHDQGVRVTTVAPGFVATPIFDDQDGAVAERLASSAADQGLAPEQVAATIVHVLSAPPEVAFDEVALRSTRQG
ncbi:SDR family oxidoreductase [Nitriliruptoraceae bacterium ZYF776]|nr:SDR family oxidoreductase [Profundirhabdus halotolerans]